MLLEFATKNFLSFKEGVNISFLLNENCPAVVDSERKYQTSKGQNYATAICIKGANASGKTCLLKALSFLIDFCKDSFSNKPDNPIAITPFSSCNNEPTEFLVRFESLKCEYIYELSLNTKEIIYERLYRVKKRKTLVLERKKNKISYVTSEFNDLKIIKLRSNASIISTANQYEIKSMKKIYLQFLLSRLSNVDHIEGLISFDSNNVNAISEWYHEDKDLFNFIKRKLCLFDLGLNDIKISYKEDMDGEKRYFPIFFHKYGNGEFKLDFKSESSGTKALYKTLHYYYFTLKFGRSLVFDEFDLHLHPHISPIIIDLFLNKKTNPYGAQIIFSTHDEKIMDKLGKYRTILINKENNESYAYRLDEIPGDILRNDRSISKPYNSGKIGGIPKV